MKRNILLAVLLVAFQSSLYSQRPALTVKEVYYCTPCGNPACDTIKYNHAGTCAVCHMALIKSVSNSQAVSPQVVADYTGHWEGLARTTDQQLKFSVDILNDSVIKILYTAAALNAMNVNAANITFEARSIHFELIGDDGITKFNGIFKNGKLAGTFITDNQAVAKKNRAGFFELKKIPARPVNYTMQEVIFRNGNVVLAGSLYLPAGAGKFPAIVCNHSSGDKPRYDGAFMADYMAKKGIAVLIYDKRGNGQSTGDWRTSGFEDLADDCIAGVKLLKSMPKIDARRIGIFGHSQGATFSPIIVRRCADIAFNIAAAGFAVSPPEQDIFRVTNVLKHEARFNKKTTDSAIRFYKIWLEVARTGKGRANMMKEDSNVKNASWYKWVEPPPANSWPWKWYLKAGNYNYIPYWEKVKIPTLLIYGDKDEVTPVKASVTRIKAALKKAGNKQYTVVIMPNATHYFAGVKKEGDLWTQSVPGYLEDIYKWIPTNAQIRSRMK